MKPGNISNDFLPWRETSAALELRYSQPIGDRMFCQSLAGVSCREIESHVGAINQEADG